MCSGNPSWRAIIYIYFYLHIYACIYILLLYGDLYHKCADNDDVYLNRLQSTSKSVLCMHLRKTNRIGLSERT
jgi:hypothetical protein